MKWSFISGRKVVNVSCKRTFRVNVTTQRFPKITASGIFRTMFLPSGYPTSVLPGYKEYSILNAAQYCIGSATSVLSMQAMLSALGVGDPSALALAAGVSWSLKDALGGLLGMALVGATAGAFDAHARAFYVTSQVLLDIATGLEIATAAFPPLFLPLSGAAAALKTLSMVAASASRASINTAFARATGGRSVADLAGRAAAQTTAAVSVGTLLGCAVAVAAGAVGAHPAVVVTVMIIIRWILASLAAAHAPVCDATVADVAPTAHRATMLIVSAAAAAAAAKRRTATHAAPRLDSERADGTSATAPSPTPSRRAARRAAHAPPASPNTRVAAARRRRVRRRTAACATVPPPAAVAAALATCDHPPHPHRTIPALIAAARAAITSSYTATTEHATITFGAAPVGAPAAPAVRRATAAAVRTQVRASRRVRQRCERGGVAVPFPFCVVPTVTPIVVRGAGGVAQRRHAVHVDVWFHRSAQPADIIAAAAVATEVAAVVAKVARRHPGVATTRAVRAGGAAAAHLLVPARCGAVLIVARLEAAGVHVGSLLPLRTPRFVDDDPKSPEASGASVGAASPN